MYVTSYYYDVLITIFFAIFCDNSTNMHFVTFTTIKFLLFITAIFNDDVKNKKSMFYLCHSHHLLVFIPTNSRVIQ